MKIRNLALAGVASLIVWLSGPTQTQALAGFFGYSVQESKEYRPSSLNRNEARSLYTAAQAKPGFEACLDLFPGKRAIGLAEVSAEWKPVALCSNRFAVLYSGTSKTPLVVIERLSKEQMNEARGEERTNQFYPDPRLPKSVRAELGDYRKSSLDRGHMAPAGNQPDPAAMAQSFALSNMVPQDPENNQKIWAKVEDDVRKYARRAPGDVYVFTGPLFRDAVRTVGRGKVWVPTHLFKLVYDAESGRAWAYILPNVSDVGVSRPITYVEFVKQTGWQFLASVPG
jgi:endonuclease G